MQKHPAAHKAPKQSRASSKELQRKRSQRSLSRRKYATVKPTHPNGPKAVKPARQRRSLADLDELPLSQEPFVMDSTTYRHRPEPSEYKVDMSSPNSPFQSDFVPPPQPSTSPHSSTQQHPHTFGSPQDDSHDQSVESSLHNQHGSGSPIPPHHHEESLEEILASIKPVYPSQFYVEPPGPEVITKAISFRDAEGDRARKQVVNFFRTSSRQSNLSKISAPVPYLLPIGESSPDTYPIPEFLLHTLYHLSGTTGANFGFGMAAPQYGVNYRMFVLRSEAFGVTSTITNIPYILETTDDNHCMVSPRHIQRTYPKPAQFDKIALAWDNPNPEYDFNSHPPVNTSKSMIDYHDMAGDDEFIQSRVRTDGVPGGIHYPLKKELPMPIKDAKQLNLCDDRILTTQFVPVSDQLQRPQARVLGRSKATSGDRVLPGNSFINEYRGYSVPLADIERDLFTPLLQAFQQQLPTTAIINPRVTAIRNEYFAMREGCFSFPHWHAFVSRPVACDVEFETLEIDGAPTPQSYSRKALNSALMSAALSQPGGSKLHYCPKASESGLDPAFLTPNITKQLEISRIIPQPSQVKLVTRKLTLRDVVAKVFLHEYDHLDGIQFFDRASGYHLNWQGTARQVKVEPHARFEYPVDIAGAYF